MKLGPDLIMCICNQGMSLLPDYIEFKKFPGTPLMDIFSAATDDLLEVLAALLCINPSKRCTASQVGSSLFFSELIISHPTEQLVFG